MTTVRIRIEELLIGAGAGALTGLSIVLACIAWAHEPGRSVVAAISVASAAIGGLAMASQPAVTHVAGTRYYRSHRVARRALRRLMQLRMSIAQRRGHVRGLPLAGVEMSRLAETESLLVQGPPGSGKTVVLSAVGQATMKRGDRMLIADPKGDFLSRIGGIGERVALLGPWDARAAIWDVAADIKGSHILARELARVIVGDGEAGGRNTYFYRAASDLLAGVVHSLGPQWTWRDLHGAIKRSAPELIQLAANHDPLIHLEFRSGEKQTDAGQDVLSTFVSRVRWIGQLAAVDKPNRQRISLRAWLLDSAGPPVLVLNLDGRYQSAGEAIFGALMAVLTGIVASPAMPERSADEPGFLLLLDELPQFGAETIRSMMRVGEIGRSRGVRIISAAQDPAQLIDLLGRDRAEAVTAMFGIHVYCRLSSQAAAMIARQVGEREVERIDTSASGGASTGKRITQERVPVILPGDLTGLKQLRRGVEVIVHTRDVLCRVVAPYRLSLPRQVTVPPHVPSPEWDAGPPPPEPTNTGVAPEHGYPEILP